MWDLRPVAYAGIEARRDEGYEIISGSSTRSTTFPLTTLT
jgi:hypothetical protein